ncbi:MAG: UvrB/UvrC motif-containing protein, partial [Anaerolineaceae bacterium]|nr:UvrB/UvrC motif-containing protein [Anaerolineaceae bacterium]
ARNVEGKVIMYADKTTDAMKTAIDETNRRRKKQKAYNDAHNLKPFTIVKEIYDITERLQTTIADEQANYSTGESVSKIPIKELRKIIKDTEERMRSAAKALEFERAAVLRDQVYELRKMLADESGVPPWKRISIISGEN